MSVSSDPSSKRLALNWKHTREHDVSTVEILASKPERRMRARVVQMGSGGADTQGGLAITISGFKKMLTRCLAEIEKACKTMVTREVGSNRNGATES